MFREIKIHLYDQIQTYMANNDFRFRLIIIYLATKNVYTNKRN